MEMESKTKEWANIISQEHVKKQDAILTEAINNAIGTGWTIETIKHRIAIHTHAAKPGLEIILLDNRPILELLPIEISTEKKGRSTFYKAGRNYRFVPYSLNTEKP